MNNVSFIASEARRSKEISLVAVNNIDTITRTGEASQK